MDEDGRSQHVVSVVIGRVDGESHVAKLRRIFNVMQSLGSAAYAITNDAAALLAEDDAAGVLDCQAVIWNGFHDCDSILRRVIEAEEKA